MTIHFGKKIHYFSELDSTNRYARKLLETEPEAGTLILTDNQTAGKGQSGTLWSSEAGKNLCFSLIICPHFLPSSHVFYLSKIVAISLQSVIQKWLPHELVQIKWANDIWVNRKKIAGVLIENQWEGSKLQYSICGIGINVNQAKFEGELTETATSFQQIGGIGFDKEILLEEILRELEVNYNLLEEKNLALIDAIYLAHLYGYRQQVEIEWQGKSHFAFVEGVEQNGQIRLWIGEKSQCFDIKSIKWKP